MGHVENSPETWRTRLKLEFRMRSLSLSTKSIALDYDKCSMRCTRVQLSAAQTGLHQWTRSIGVLKAAQEVLLEPRTLFRTSSISSKKGFNVAFFPAKTKSKKK